MINYNTVIGNNRHTLRFIEFTLNKYMSLVPERNLLNGFKSWFRGMKDGKI
jgi:hypothetical protein